MSTSKRRTSRPNIGRMPGYCPVAGTNIGDSIWNGAIIYNMTTKLIVKVPEKQAPELLLLCESIQ